jgi:hypothetical protein
MPPELTSSLWGALAGGLVGGVTGFLSGLLLEKRREHRDDRPKRLARKAAGPWLSAVASAGQSGLYSTTEYGW